MSSLESKKLEYQLMNVRAARMGNEIKIDEQLQYIEEIKRNIEKQIEREHELEREIKKLKGE